MPRTTPNSPRPAVSTPACTSPKVPGRWEIVGTWLASADGAALSASEVVALRRSALDADRLVLGLGTDVGTAGPAAADESVDAAAIGAQIGSPA